MITKKCKQCGSLFSRYPSYFKNRAGVFCSYKCMLDFNSIDWKINNPAKDLSGKNNPMYGKKPWNYSENGSQRKDGYFRITLNGKRLLKHRILAEKKLGRKLKKLEIVHHIDGNNTNNNLENLLVISQSEHCKLHNFGYKGEKR